MAPARLPAKLPSKTSALSSNIGIAYREILKLEKSSDEKKTMYARILGYLLLHGPSDEARKTVADEAVSCTSEDQLAKNGKSYLDYYIRAFKKFKGPTPTMSSHSPQPRFYELKSTILRLLKESPGSHEAAKDHALVRDGYRCLVTGNGERSMAQHNLKLKEDVMASRASIVSTQCAHIFDSSTNRNLGKEGSTKRDYAASVWAVMNLFGYRDILDNLNGDKINYLDNILTLDPGAHDLFDRSEIWFEPTGEQHEYRLGGIDPAWIYKYAEKPVKFTTPDPNKYPIPSPRYLQIHAACAKIAHLSGAGEYIDKIPRDLEDTNVMVLSKDSASAELPDPLPSESSLDHVELSV